MGNYMSNDPAPLALDYRPIDRARRAVAGGLRLLGVLTCLFGLLAVVMSLLSGQFASIRGHFREPRVFLMVGIVLATIFLGLAKTIIAQFVARRIRPASYVALSIVSAEILVLLYFLVQGVMLAQSPYSFVRHDGQERVVAMSFVLLGWAAVDFEIVQTLRLSD
jgi:MFS family permease